MDSVLNKTIFYRRWMTGEFGNRPQSWSSLEDLMNSKYSGNVVIRHINPASGLTKYGIEKSKVQEYISNSKRPVAEFRFNEPLDDSKLMIQGEIMRDFKGINLTYSREKIPMRKAMENPLHVFGLSATIILKTFLDQGSYEWIEYLLDNYQDHVIEFTTMSYRLGTENLNTIIWEVRKY